jgi:hypothetical protein
VLKIFNLNDNSLQIRSKQWISGENTKQCETRFKLSEFQSGIIKQARNMRMYKPQIRIVNHDHFTPITWLDTHIIVHGSKRSNLRKSTFKLKIQFLVLTKDLTKQLILIAKSIFKFGDSQRKTIGDESSLTSESESNMCRDDLPMRQRSVKSPVLYLGISSSSELEESSLEKSRSLRAVHARGIIF